MLSAPPDNSLGREARLIGPGLLFMLGSVGARDLVSGSIAGATYGYSLLWLLLVSVIARFVILDSTARYVIVSGESLLAGFGRISRWIVLLWFIVAVFQRHTSALTKLLMLGTAAHLIFPLPTARSRAILGLCSWLLGFALMYWGRYRLVEYLSKPLAVVLGGCLMAAAILSGPDPAELIKGIVTPVLPVGEGTRNSALIFMVVISAATASLGNLKYSAYVHEKGWRNLSYLSGQRKELVLSVCGMFCMFAMIHIAAAGALRPRGIEVNDLDDLIPIFGQVFGYRGGLIMGITLWCMVFSSYLNNGTSYGIMFSDVYNRYVHKQPAGETTQELAAGDRPAYRWVVVFLFVSPLYGVLTDWTPVGLVILRSASTVLTLPIITLSVLRLTADRKIMGAHVNGWFTNLVLVVTSISAIAVGCLGVVELLGHSQ